VCDRPLNRRYAICWRKDGRKHQQYVSYGKTSLFNKQQAFEKACKIRKEMNEITGCMNGLRKREEVLPPKRKITNSQSTVLVKRVKIIKEYFKPINNESSNNNNDFIDDDDSNTEEEIEIEE